MLNSRTPFFLRLLLGALIAVAPRPGMSLAPAAGDGGGDPFKGYYFKVLTRQGLNPPGGRYDYVINGNMIGGFALVAFPADHGNSGIMTFVVSHHGNVMQKDLGEDTDLIAGGMEEYNPDETWEPVID